MPYSPRRHGKVALGATALAALLALPGVSTASERDAVERGARAAALKAAADDRAPATAVPECESIPTHQLRRDSTAWIYLYCANAGLEDSATVKVVDRPDHGNVNVEVDAGYVQYVPKPGYVGPDSLQIVKSNSVGDSAPVTVSFDVTASANTEPYCYPYATDGELSDPHGSPYGHVNARKTHGRVGYGQCYDHEGDAMTFVVKQQPASGTLTPGTSADGAPMFTYMPDSSVSDGTQVTAEVAVVDEHGAEGGTTLIGFNVQPATYNTHPFCPSDESISFAWATAEAGETTTLDTAACFDGEGDPVSLSKVADPPNGTVATLAGGSRLVLTSTATSGTTVVNFNGTDDPPGDIAPLTSLSAGSARARNYPAHADPSCAPGSYSTPFQTRGDFEMPCADADGDHIYAYAFSTGSGHRWAQHGDVEIRNVADGKLRFAYLPDPGFSGTDEFLVEAEDQFDSGAPQKVTITVLGAGGDGTGGGGTSGDGTTGGGSTGGGSTGGGSTGPTPEQAKAAMTTLLSNETLEFLQEVAGQNKKGIDRKKPVLSLGTVGSEQLPNGGTAQFGVFDKPAGTLARAADASKKRKSLGSTKVTLAKGQSKAVKVKLNAKGRSLLRKKGKVKLTVDATLTDALTGAVVTKSKTYAFKVKKKK